MPCSLGNGLSCLQGGRAFNPLISLLESSQPQGWGSPRPKQASAQRAEPGIPVGGKSWWWSEHLARRGDTGGLSDVVA